MPTAAFATRKENLRRLVLDKYDGNRAALARAAGVHQNQINLLLSDNEDHARNMGEALARRMEGALGLDPGFLDESHDPMAGSTRTIHNWEVPATLAHLFSRHLELACFVMYDANIGRLMGSITSPANLRICRAVTHDMAPLITPSDTAVVDIGVKAVTQDGVYILQHGSGVFLRRVARSLAGGFTITAASPDIEQLRIETLKGIRALGRVVTVTRRELL